MGKARGKLFETTGRKRLVALHIFEEVVLWQAKI
jgi:hypothetical protein